MKLRVRLILAFLLLSVVPLGAATIYTYVSSYRALQAVATRDADQLAEELSQRMQLVTAQLSARVEHLMDLSAMQGPVAPAPPVVTKAEPAVTETEMATIAINSKAADALGEAAMLLNTVELSGLRRSGGARGRGGPPPGLSRVQEPGGEGRAGR